MCLRHRFAAYESGALRAAYPWDAEEPLVVLTPVHLARVLSRYMQGEITAQELEDWANAIESREDIAYETAHKAPLAQAIYQLANPLLTQPITPVSIQQLFATLAA